MIYRAFKASLPGCMMPHAVDLNRVSGAPPLEAAVGRDIDERRVYLKWASGVHPEIKKITLGVVIYGRALSGWEVPPPGSTDSPISKKVARARLKAGLDAFVFVQGRAGQYQRPGLA